MQKSVKLLNAIEYKFNLLWIQGVGVDDVDKYAKLRLF